MPGFLSEIRRCSSAYRRLSAGFSLDFPDIFISHGESAFARICGSGASGAWRYGGEASRPLHGDGLANPWRRSHEEDSMRRRNSSNTILPMGAAGLTRFSLEGRAKRAGCFGGSGISINIAKFTGLFDKFLKINRRMMLRKMLKYNDFMKNMSPGRSDKGPENFFPFRNCPQIRCVERASAHFPASPHHP